MLERVLGEVRFEELSRPLHRAVALTLDRLWPNDSRSPVVGA